LDLYDPRVYKGSSKESKGYELQFVIAIVMDCHGDGATLVLKNQQPAINMIEATPFASQLPRALD